VWSRWDGKAFLPVLALSFHHQPKIRSMRNGGTTSLGYNGSLMQPDEPYLMAGRDSIKLLDAICNLRLLVALPPPVDYDSRRRMEQEAFELDRGNGDMLVMFKT
jgi:hypothetical protein